MRKVKRQSNPDSPTDRYKFIEGMTLYIIRDIPYWEFDGWESLEAAMDSISIQEMTTITLPRFTSLLITCVYDDPFFEGYDYRFTGVSLFGGSTSSSWSGKWDWLGIS